MADILLKLRVKNFGEMKIELYPEIVPNTVANFVDYVESKFFNGLIFHRIIKNFMIQGGGGVEKKRPIKGEFTANGFKNELKHTKGVISMARTSDPNSATSQFFIMHKDAPHLDGQYAAFGKVIEGLEIIDKIATVRTDYYDKPYENVVIESFEVIEKNVDLPKVQYV
ncbi:peptidylprolyl isomerase [Acholeplasma hippikon]|nr:peptidylprolyl isomerase [Acholeplasma hippikon]